MSKVPTLEVQAIELAITETQEIELSLGARLLNLAQVGDGRSHIVLYVLENPAAERKPRMVRIARLGRQLPIEVGFWRFAGMATLSGRAHHVFIEP